MSSAACDHWWTDYATLRSGDNPPLEIEACRLCGVQRKKQNPRKSIPRPDLRTVVSANLPAFSAGNCGN